MKFHEYKKKTCVSINLVVHYPDHLTKRTVSCYSQYKVERNIRIRISIIDRKHRRIRRFYVSSE